MGTSVNCNNVSSPRPVPFQHGPDHYTRWAIQPAEFCLKNKLDFVRGNIIKYIMRHDAKGGLKDLDKARHYLDMLCEETKKEHNHDY